MTQGTPDIKCASLWWLLAQIIAVVIAVMIAVDSASDDADHQQRSIFQSTPAPVMDGSGGVTDITVRVTDGKNYEDITIDVSRIIDPNGHVFHVLQTIIYFNDVTAQLTDPVELDHSITNIPFGFKYDLKLFRIESAHLQRSPVNLVVKQFYVFRSSVLQFFDIITQVPKYDGSDAGLGVVRWNRNHFKDHHLVDFFKLYPKPLLDHVRYYGEYSWMTKEQVFRDFSVWMYDDINYITDDKGMIKPGQEEEKVRALVQCFVIMWIAQRKDFKTSIVDSVFSQNNIILAVMNEDDTRDSFRIIREVLEQYYILDYLKSIGIDTLQTALDDFILQSTNEQNQKESIMKLMTEVKNELPGLVDDLEQMEDSDPFWREFVTFLVGFEYLSSQPASLQRYSVSIDHDDDLRAPVMVRTQLRVPPGTTLEMLKREMAASKKDDYRSLIVTIKHGSDLYRKVQLDDLMDVSGWTCKVWMFEGQYPRTDKVMVELTKAPIRVSILSSNEFQLTVSGTLKTYFIHVTECIPNRVLPTLIKIYYSDRLEHLRDLHNVFTLTMSHFGVTIDRVRNRHDTYFEDVLRYFEDRPITDDEGMFLADASAKDIYDFTVVLCYGILEELKGERILPITESLFSKWNIIMAVADLDVDLYPKRMEYFETTIQEMTNEKRGMRDRLKLSNGEVLTNNEDDLKAYCQLRNLDELQCPPSFKDVVRIETGESSMFIRKVLAEFNFLYAFEYLYDQGELNVHLNNIWKTEYFIQKPKFDALRESIKNENAEWLVRVHPLVMSGDPGQLFEQYDELNVVTLMNRVQWSGEKETRQWSRSEVMNELLSRVVEWYSVDHNKDNDDKLMNLVRYVCIALLNYNHEIPFPFTRTVFDPQDIIDAVKNPSDDHVVKKVLKEYHLHDFFQSISDLSSFLDGIWVQPWSDQTAIALKTSVIELFENKEADLANSASEMKKLLDAQTPENPIWRKISKYWFGTDKLSVDMDPLQMNVAILDSNDPSPVVHVDRCTNTLYVPSNFKFTGELDTQAWEQVMDEPFEPLKVFLLDNIEIDLNEYRPLPSGQLILFVGGPKLGSRNSRGFSSKLSHFDVTFEIKNCGWDKVNINVRTVTKQPVKQLLKDVFRMNLDRNPFPDPLSVDELKLMEDPGYLFNKHEGLPLFNKVHLERDERGSDAGGLFNHVLGKVFQFYNDLPQHSTDDQDESKLKLTNEEGIFLEGKDRKMIRDLTQWTILGLLSEAGVDHGPAWAKVECPVTQKVFSPWNIWLALADADYDTDHFQDPDNCHVKAMFSALTQIDRDSQVKEKYCDIMGDKGVKCPVSVRDLVRKLTSESSLIIREVLAEYNVLSLFNVYYKQGTLITKLNEMWKSDFGPKDALKLKNRALELAKNYRAGFAGASQALVTWLDEIDPETEFETMENLLDYWTGMRVLSDARLNALNIVWRDDPNPVLASQTCSNTLYVPNSFGNDPNQVDTLMTTIDYDHGFRDQ